MKVNPREFPNTQKLNVFISNTESINVMLKRTMEEMGRNFFTYSTKDNNCQDFMWRFLDQNHLLTPDNQRFIKQDIEESFKGLTGLRKALNTVTDMASWFDVLKQGGDLNQNNGLSDMQINDILKNVSTFSGCYPKDELPPQLIKGHWYIVNMQDANDGDGTHWICFKYGYPVTYYDSFGIAPPIEIMKIAKLGLIWNSKQIQNEKSTACGWFCIACVLSDYEDGHRDTTTHFNRFLNYFSSNTVVNDRMLKKMLNHYLA